MLHLIVNDSASVCNNLSLFFERNYPNDTIRIVTRPEQAKANELLYTVNLPVSHELLGVTLQKLFGIERLVPSRWR